ncbi:CPBP family intramembrane glutamic endopeptidase [Chitinophagaceae bacterium LWZ2-11]
MINSICDCLLQTLILLPFIILAKLNNKDTKTINLILALLIFVATSVATDLLNISLFKEQRWNWGGKVAALIIALVFIFANKKITPQQFGLTAKVETKNARRIFLICAAYALFRFVLYLTMTKEGSTFHVEAILYQATMPGITEEIIFRGILLTLLNRAFVTPKWTLANVSFGWAAIITSLLFGLVHGFYFDNDYHIKLNIFSILQTAFDGFLFAMLAEKTKSLLPSILFHNILNLIGTH